MRIFSGFLNNNHITRYCKNIRNNIVNKSYLMKDLKFRSFSFSSFENDQAVVFYIAFNKPLCIEIMIDCWNKFAHNTKLIVVDNSSDKKAKLKIRECCNKSSIDYIELPENPEWHPNRSHALAMNWVYYNIVQAIKPSLFGYIDHDCFPYTNFDLSGKMEGFKVMGERRFSSKKLKSWNLWAGFCFYDRTFIADRIVNFTHSIELGLDTGGGNWHSIYIDLDELDAAFSSVILGSEFMYNSGQQFHCIIDDFVHLGSMSHATKSKNMSKESISSLIPQLSKAIKVINV